MESKIRMTTEDVRIITESFVNAMSAVGLLVVVMVSDGEKQQTAAAGPPEELILVIKDGLDELVPQLLKDIYKCDGKCESCEHLDEHSELAGMAVLGMTQ